MFLEEYDLREIGEEIHQDTNTEEKGEEEDSSNSRL